MQENFELRSPVAFQREPLTEREQLLHMKALRNAKRYAEAEAELLNVIKEVDRTRLYLKFDLNSTFAYCLEYLGLSEAVAFNFINVARKSIEVPELQSAIQSGRLGVSKARKIVPVLTKENKDEWIQKAIELPQAKLEREVAERAPVDRARDVHERLKPVKGERVKLEFIVSEEAAEKLRRAQELLCGKKRRNVSLEETLAAVLEEFLRREDPVRKTERAQARMRKQKEASEKSDNGFRHSDGGNNRGRSEFVAKPSGNQASLQDACPSRVARQVKRAAATGSFSWRPIPAEVLHAVYRRDRGRCQARRADGTKCGARKFLELHHIVPVAKGGTDTVGNLITLCSRCHRKWHRQLELNPRQVGAMPLPPSPRARDSTPPRSHCKVAVLNDSRSRQNQVSIGSSSIESRASRSPVPTMR